MGGGWWVVGSGKWEVGSEKWEVRSEKWEVGWTDALLCFVVGVKLFWGSGCGANFV
ncbi:MAG: hypothetical protein RLZZ458_2488 [Planctomycetota bacterium]